jgi:DNA-3-methyladenine glycosylase II
MRIIESDADVLEGVRALLRLDPRLEDIVAHAGPLPLRRSPPGFSGLAEIIVAQMISKASAAAIWNRMVAQMGQVDAQIVLAMSEADSRAIGLSRAKIAALRAAAAAVDAGLLDLDGICRMDAPKAVGALSALPGVGRWTAEVYLLFCAGHPDVFPVGDVALQSAVAHGLGLGARPSPRALDTISRSWSPWRGVAARLFWAYYATHMRRNAAPGSLR